MSLKTSIYSGAKNFVSSSASTPQWSKGVKYGAGAFAAYGAIKGAVDDRQTVIGGSVGGAAFGGAVGAASAYALHRNKGLRNLASSSIEKANNFKPRRVFADPE